MADAAKINEALAQLDTENDNHWTQAGEPRLETVRMLVGDQSVSRADIDAATKDYNRQAARDAKAPPAPPVVDAGAPGGTVTGAVPPAPPPPAQPQIEITAPTNADGDTLPTDVAPLASAPPADGLPTAGEPAMVEGGTPQDRAQDAETRSDAIDGSIEAGRPVQIAQGTTEKGYNALNDEEDDLRDAQASTAPSPNAPEALGGAPGAHGNAATGLSNEAGGDESTEQRPGEAELSTVDRGTAGDPDAVKDLEAQLAEVGKTANYARGMADKWQARVLEATAEESRLRVAIEQARPRGGTMPAIQDYFASQDQRTDDLEAARRAVRDAGLDMKQLNKLFEKAPIDKAQADDAK